MEFVGDDRLKALQQFDEPKKGLNGLVDSGLTSIPSIFIQPPEILSEVISKIEFDVLKASIAVMDLFCVNSDRSTLVKQIAKASRELGFCQMVNHEIPVEVLERTTTAIKRFHEQPDKEKAKLYGGNSEFRIEFLPNFDLFFSKAENWRNGEITATCNETYDFNDHGGEIVPYLFNDTLQMRLHQVVLELEKIPEVCRKELIERDKQVKKLGEILMEILSEGLGLNSTKLKEMKCLEGKELVGHYYPHCPQPNLAIGTPGHADPNILSVPLEDHVGGLQVKVGGQWVDVEPIHGALLVNIGDVLHIISNGEYQSVEHKVLANPLQEPRISVALFFNPGDRESTYGPLPKLISPEKPSLYKPFVLAEALQKFASSELNDKTLAN